LIPPSPAGVLPLDPRTGGVISPIIAAALFIKLLGLLTPRQPEKVDILKQALPVFACMRSLAMRFRGLLRSNDPDALDDWIRDAVGCGIHTMQKFAVKLRYDISAVRNAICEPWASQCCISPNPDASPPSDQGSPNVSQNPITVSATVACCTVPMREACHLPSACSGLAHRHS
jgi:hypothetical protein